MEKIDIQNFNKYYRNVDGNSTLARVGHVNYVIDGLTQKIIEVINQEVVTQNNILNLGLAAVSGLNKINNYSITAQGRSYDIYSLQAYTQLSGSNVYVIPLGYITTSSININLGTSSSAVLANDSLFQGVVTPLGVGSLVTDNDPTSITFGEVYPVNFMAINVDNTITTPDEYYIFLLAGDSTSFECNIAIDGQVSVDANSAVEYNN